MSRAAASLLMLMIFSTACAPAVPQDEYDRQVEELAALQEEFQLLADENESLQETVAASEDELTSTKQELEELDDHFDDLQARFRSAQLDLNSLGKQVGLYECEETLTGMEYDEIMNISARLQAWVTNQPWASRAVLSVRDTIWNNTDTKLHGITYVSSDDNERYLTWFLVYFDEFGWEEACIGWKGSTGWSGGDFLEGWLLQQGIR